MALVLSSSLLFLVSSSVWVALSLPSPVGAADGQAGGEQCPPFSCGYVTISFPFGLIPEGAEQTNCRAGMGFQVRCYNNNIPYLGSFQSDKICDHYNLFSHLQFKLLVASKPECPLFCEKKITSTLILVSISVAASLLLPCIYVLVWHRQKLRFFLCKKTTSSTTEENIEALILLHGSLAPKRYKYSEVTKITSSLNNKLGEGGYGMVFKGRLDDGRLVAVKFLHDSKGDSEEFVNEVMSIGRTSHINIVSLFGFCLEGSKRALIYEYMPNGSLDKYIYSENPKAILGWDKLYTIAIGIARGLEYLHHSCNTHIVHFDIKPQNILLDQNFHPKIADFGLDKLCHTKESKLSMTGARGTPGFIAPEVHSRTFGVVSAKSDVYSYGMMLLEMVGGRKNVKSMAQESSEKYFPHWIYDHFGHDDGLPACEVTRENKGISRKMSVIGLWCIQILPMHRPTIGKVLEMFERGSDELDMPPRQNFSQIFNDPAYSLNAESSSMISGTKTQVSSEVLKMKEIIVVNSKILQWLPTL
ncbi:LEAF RUST 10 DISEASE-RESISTANCEUS RECEPTOR-LIKE PROTEIN KINASE-like 2.5 [Miscanthus floridulus]|uniref:LEAF RUST 10 DISEASE-RESISTANCEUS RECEPTOR-LIKE PROTEIN KINASE-like 2.5 n=1 Tax=Miscanthus floridulus TaxID=154761 RepID=UPI00345ADFF0